MRSRVILAVMNMDVQWRKGFAGTVRRGCGGSIVRKSVAVIVATAFADSSVEDVWVVGMGCTARTAPLNVLASIVSNVATREGTVKRVPTDTGVPLAKKNVRNIAKASAIRAQESARLARRDTGAPIATGRVMSSVRASATRALVGVSTAMTVTMATCAIFLVCSTLASRVTVRLVTVHGASRVSGVTTARGNVRRTAHAVIHGLACVMSHCVKAKPRKHSPNIIVST